MSLEETRTLASIKATLEAFRSSFEEHKKSVEKMDERLTAVEKFTYKSMGAIILLNMIVAAWEAWKK